MTHFSLRQFLLNDHAKPRAKTAPKRSRSTLNNTDRIQNYYAEASDGYRDWSQKLNMHFGTFEWGINPFNLESMLENTNRQVLDSLQLEGDNNHVLDMGCGLGGTMRFAAHLPAIEQVTGVTIAANQVAEAEAISAAHPQKHKLAFINADYHHTELKAETFDGAYAIESACHSLEANKASLINEAYRLLKPGRTFTLCDGFIKSSKPMNPATHYCYQKTCQHWALGHFPHLDATITAIADAGFEDINVVDLSWQVLPSALYIPWMVAKYGAKLLYNKDKNPEHWNHLLAPAWGLALACSRSYFGYYRVSATKPAAPAKNITQ